MDTFGVMVAFFRVPRSNRLHIPRMYDTAFGCLIACTPQCILGLECVGALSELHTVMIRKLYFVCINSDCCNRKRRRG